MGAATLGVAACAGGTDVGAIPGGGSGTGPGTTSPGKGGTPTATPGPGTTPAPGATPSASPTPPTPFPAGSVSNGVRGPNSLPDSTRPAGQANPNLPFDTVIIVMMENHSFDNYFGMLPLRGQPLADGFTFDANGVPQNKNPLHGGYQHVFHLQGTCAPYAVTQAWDPTHEQVADGAMNGFAATCDTAMGYWDESDLPFYYSLAKTFCLGNRAFCSVQAQTYPNRRFLYAGSSGGLVSTSDATFSEAYPANGTLMDMMNKYGVTWANYFVDLPATAIIPQTVEKYPSNYLPIATFFAQCAAGTLPNVCFVDPEFNASTSVGGPLATALAAIPDLPASVQAGLVEDVNAQGGSEENPSDIAIGEAFVAEVVNAVLKSPQWKSTLLIWTYDEHGGYYDHVPPLGAVKPDDIPPTISATDVQAAFNVTGVRVPTVVVSPYSRPNAVTNVPHDHTSIIATIAAKWNLPALTYRDAQAATLFDYLNLSGPPAFLTPPTLAAPAQPEAVSGGHCASSPPPDTITPDVVRVRRR